MSEQIKHVSLIKNEIYPTFQLYAEMANEKTDVKDGLNIAAQTTIEWVLNRVGDDASKELKELTPDKSIYISSGYIINIVSLPNEGVWTLQITEPDLGSDPGKKDQDRLPVPGRIIETNIGFYIKENKLQCGFKIVMSDPVGTEVAEVYRLGIVRQLVYNKDFGLKQIIPITHEYTLVDNANQFNNLVSLYKNVGNQLPVVLFTQLESKMPSIDEITKLDPTLIRLGKAAPITKTDNFAKLPYDIGKFAKYGVGMCRTYLVKGFCDKLDCNPGDIIVIEPKFAGNKRTVFKMASDYKATIDKLNKMVHNYPLKKKIDFGNVVFLTKARSELITKNAADIQKEDTLSKEYVANLINEYQQKVNAEIGEKEKYQEKVKDREEKIQSLKDQIKDNEEDYQKEINRLNTTIKAKELRLEYLKRKDLLPKTHKEIIPWVEKNFEGRLILHDKAKKLLEDKDAQKVDVELICNSLEFLATEYYDLRYNGKTQDEINIICAEKYERLFDITHQSGLAIEAYPNAYKIKYEKNQRTGKPQESPLNYHLRCGNTAPFLIRVYFLHDDDNKLIVVGSLPNHLPTFSNKT